MGMVVTIKGKPWIKRLWHKLFECPTFWRWRRSFECPECGKRYRCYWDGNDVAGHGIDYCGKCAAELEGASHGAG